MNVKPIKTEEDYKEALSHISSIFDASPGTPEFDLLDVLTTLVEVYESRNEPIAAPDPIAAIEYEAEKRGLTRKDLEKYIGASGRVSEVMNRQRPLSISMIRKLRNGLGISADVLITEQPSKRASRPITGRASFQKVGVVR
jgi:HTH-type transcriptional regulator/antitoxin HigA